MGARPGDRRGPALRVRPLPRLHAVTDARVLALKDLGIRAAAIAAAGPSVALHARDREATGAELARAALRLQTLVRPPQASLFVNARADLAEAIGAQGVQLGGSDISSADARRVFPAGWIGRSVHGVAEAGAAFSEGADFIVLGNVYESASHPGRQGVGLPMVREASRLGGPVIAIGGITAARAREVREAGAYGVAAISALWDASDPAAAAVALLAPWMEEA
jgi:thiamine-phosphate diphosphorylase